MFPKFDDGDYNEENRLKFTLFVRDNKSIFDKLLLSGRFYLTRGFDHHLVLEGYGEFIALDPHDNTERIYDLDEDNTDIHEFVHWWETSKNAQTYFKKVANEQKAKEPKLNKKSKRRTMKRTAQIKHELLQVDIEPDDDPHSVKGKTYRTARDRFGSLHFVITKAGFIPQGYRSATGTIGVLSSSHQRGGKTRKTPSRS